MHSYRQDDDSASCSASDDEEETDVKAPVTEKGTCVQSGDKLLIVIDCHNMIVSASIQTYYKQGMRSLTTLSRIIINDSIQKYLSIQSFTDYTHSYLLLLTKHI